jgi:hypothetical protein
MLELYHRLGYRQATGLCHGISLRWMEACMLGEEQRFHNRMEKMMLSPEETAQSIREAKAKKGVNLTEKDTDALEVLAFFDGLALFHRPDEYGSLFNEPKFLNQNDVELVSNFASSEKIRESGGLAKIYSHPGIYTKAEMKKYLDNMGNILQSVAASSKETIGILLSSGSHAIALTYTSDQGWRCMDINQYPSKPYDTKNTEPLVECIVAGFSGLEDDFTAFNTTVFTTGNYPLLYSLREQLEPLKMSLTLTEEIARRTANVNGVNLAFIAAFNGHSSVIEELAKLEEVDLNRAASSGATPAYIAAQNGHAPVIAELAKHGRVDLNLAESSGVTPALIAAQHGHSSVIEELIKYGVDINAPFKSSADSLTRFSGKFGEEVLGRMNEFLKKQLAADKTAIPMTPFDIAVIMGHKKTARLIEEKLTADKTVVPITPLPNTTNNRFFGGGASAGGGADADDTNKPAASPGL